jgi:hypothetical protein
VADSPERKQPDDAERGSASAEEPRRERRARHRVRDDQKSGQGSLSALSKLQMLERQRAELHVSRDDE